MSVNDAGSDRELKVLERMEIIRLERPDGKYPTAFCDHGDWCIECEALRRLEEEADEQE